MEERKKRKSDAPTQVSSGTVILHLCLLTKFRVIFTVIRGIYLGPLSTLSLSTEVSRQMLLDTSPVKATSNCLEERGLYTRKCTNYFLFF